MVDGGEEVVEVVVATAVVAAVVAGGSLQYPGHLPRHPHNHNRRMRPAQNSHATLEKRDDEIHSRQRSARKRTTMMSISGRWWRPGWGPISLLLRNAQFPAREFSVVILLPHTPSKNRGRWKCLTTHGPFLGSGCRRHLPVPRCEPPVQALFSQQGASGLNFAKYDAIPVTRTGPDTSQVSDRRLSGRDGSVLRFHGF